MTMMNNTNTTPTSALNVQVPHPERSTMQAVLVGNMIILTLLSNTFTCVVICKYESLRTITNIYIFNLCVSGNLVALTSMPVWLLYQLHRNNIWEVLGTSLLHYWGLMDMFCGTASIVSLTAICVDRCLVIKRPLTYGNNLRWRWRIIAVVGIWCYSLTIALSRKAVWKNNDFAHFAATFSFFLPLSIIVITQATIFKVARYQSLAIQPISRILSIRELKATRTISIVIGQFIAFWLPFILTTLTMAYVTTVIIPFGVINMAKWLTYCNTFMNPLVFGMFDRRFRETVKNKIVRKWMTRHPCVRPTARVGIQLQEF